MKTIIRLFKGVDETNFPFTYLIDDDSAAVLVEKGLYREVTEADLKSNPWFCMTSSAVGDPVVSMVMVPPHEVVNREAAGLRKVTDEEFSIIAVNLQQHLDKKEREARRLTQALAETRAELESAVREFGPMKSLHEAYGVIAEEYREFEEHVFMNARTRDLSKTRGELTQLAAMAIRTMIDCC